MASTHSFRSQRPRLTTVNVLDEATRQMPSLVSREDNLLPVRHPVQRMLILFNAATIEFLDCARPGRQKLQLGISNRADGPFPIRRKITRHAFAQWNRGRPT